jgi:hypothetical protein
MQQELETDYLVVGAGTAGMAFTDALLTHSDATLTIVDRRHAPGGHWVDAYPFVRLHQPSAFYGVDSMPLGHDAIDATGLNEGFYELAGADEIRAYYDRVMHQRFLPSKRVRFFPSCDYVSEAGEHRIVSRLDGTTRTVRVKKKLVDSSFLENKVPATSPPPFPVAEGVRIVTPTELARIDKAPERYVIIGAGKTALDACVWLLDRGVPAKAIRWVRPREAWWLNRKFQQPHTLLPDMMLGTAIQVEAMAQASSREELFTRLESEGIFLRIDPKLEATMFRGAIMSERELHLLRAIEDVIRLGRVQRIDRDAIVLDGGRVPTDTQTVHVHCATRALGLPPKRPIFEQGRITMQPFSWGFASYQFATLGVVEALLETEDQKNAVCPSIVYWDQNVDYLIAFLATMSSSMALGSHPKVASWTKSTRLNPMSGIGPYREDPRVVASRERVKRFGLAAAMNLQKLIEQGP